MPPFLQLSPSILYHGIVKKSNVFQFWIVYFFALPFHPLHLSLAGLIGGMHNKSPPQNAKSIETPGNAMV